MRPEQEIFALVVNALDEMHRVHHDHETPRCPIGQLLARAKETIKTGEPDETRRWMLENARTNENRTLGAIYGRQA